jgi:hypothetical protein
MSEVHHSEESRDCLYNEASDNLETIFALWQEGRGNLRFAIPVLCAVKLEAFINVAGKLHLSNWDKQERKLSFSAKCKAVCGTLRLEFASAIEPNRTAVEVFEVRNSLVHPKMILARTNERISQKEYERRSTTMLGPEHPLRSALTPARVVALMEATNAFVAHWARECLMAPQNIGCVGDLRARLSGSHRTVSPNPSIERTSQRPLRALWPAAHVER